MKRIIGFVKREPVRVYGIVVAGLAFAVSLGLDMSAGQQGAFLALVAVVLGVGGETVRANVTPVSKR